MAERRMFSKTIIDSDMFLDMPLSTQALYFHLSMRGDDDGFINNPKKIQRMIGATDDDLKILAAKQFIIPFESGIVVIKHWRIHNCIKKDRYKETIYQYEKQHLSLNDQLVYDMETNCIQNGTKTEPECIQNGSNMETQVRLGKVRLGKDSLGKEHVAKNCNVSSKKTTELPPTLQTPEFLAVWEEWQSYRKQKRKTLTESTIKKQLEFLASIGVVDAIISINESIKNGYTGLFPVKQAARNKNDNGFDAMEWLKNA
jgi:hypothetical protein